MTLIFGAWIQYLEWHQWSLATLSSTIRRFSNRLVSAVWSAWVERARTGRRLRYIAVKIQIRQQERLLLRNFRHYRTVTLRAVATRKRHEVYLAHHAHALVMANRRLACGRLMRNVIRAWAAAVAGSHSKRNLAKRVENAMRRRLLSTVCSTWASFVLSDPRDVKMEQLQETIALLYSHDRRRACCIDVFKTWLLFIEQCWEMRATAKQNIDNLALELAIQTETNRFGPGRRVPSLRY